MLPVWEDFLDRPPVVDPSNAETRLDNLLLSANYQNSHYGFGVGAGSQALSPTPTHHVESGLSEYYGNTRAGGQVCVGSVLPGSRPRPAQELEALLKKVTDKFGGPDLESKHRTTLAALSDLTGQATQRGLCNWSGAAVKKAFP